MADALSGMDISKIMSEEGTLVKCVVLRCHPYPSATATTTECANDPQNTKDISEMSIKEIKAELKSFGVTEQFVEKDELIRALEGERAKLSSFPKVGTGDEKPPSSYNNDYEQQPSNSESAAAFSAVPLSHLIEEITIDTTPRKSQVAKLLGGDFTFLGQYEDEGIMVMVRRPTWEKEVHNNNEEEEEVPPPINPHRLHPPLNDVEVRGDILLMRVAETHEELDEDHDEEEENDDEQSAELEGKEADNEVTTDHEASAKKKLHVPSSEEFFLDYTRDEYLKFAARTDVTWEQPDEEESEEEQDENHQYLQNDTIEGHESDQDDDDDDAPYDPEQDEEEGEEYYDTEEHQIGMMNLILGQILRKFHEENGRGPNTLELLDMRKALADKLGVDVPEVDEEACDWDKKAENTPRKHGRRVVVDEEKNECETILLMNQSREEEKNAGDSSSLKRSAEMMENGSTGDCVGVEQSLDNEECNTDLKRPPEEDGLMENGVSQSDEGSIMNKKQKLEEDSVSGDS
jgi:hypothetical protein